MIREASKEVFYDHIGTWAPLKAAGCTCATLQGVIHTELGKGAGPFKKASHLSKVSKRDNNSMKDFTKWLPIGH